MKNFFQQFFIKNAPQNVSTQLEQNVDRKQDGGQVELDTYFRHAIPIRRKDTVYRYSI